MKGCQINVFEIGEKKRVNLLGKNNQLEMCGLIYLVSYIKKKLLRRTG